MTSFLKLIGNTPLLKIEKNLFAKLELFNPSGSMKDRIVKSMILDIKHNTDAKTIVEATSGNTGISLAMLAPQLGFSAEIYIPENMSVERKNIIKSFGATLIETRTMEEAQKRAKERGRQKNICYLNQFENQKNVETQYLLGKEIIEEVDFEPEYFVVGIGTGGTIMGAGKALKEAFPKIKIIGVLPAKMKNNKIEGIGDYYSKKIVDLNHLDKIERVKNQDAINATQYLIKNKGLFVGISSGANYFVSKKFSNTVTVFADSADRYYSTDLFHLKT